MSMFNAPTEAYDAVEADLRRLIVPIDVRIRRHPVRVVLASPIGTTTGESLADVMAMVANGAEVSLESQDADTRRARQLFKKLQADPHYEDLRAEIGHRSAGMLLLQLLEALS